MADLHTALVTQDAELEALAPIVAWAFGDKPSGSLEWLRGAGNEQVRVARQGTEIVGGLVEVPMGQWFGGESVRTMGLAGVAVAPEARGRRLAFGIVQQALRAARGRGFALSTLYPSTFGLYRKLGYELAGSHCRFSVQLRRLARAKSPLEVHALGPERQAEVARLYTDIARSRPGYLDRGPYVWKRVQNPKREPGRGFGVSDARGLAGYVFMRPSGQVPLELLLSDFVTRTPEAFECLLTFLASHLTTADQASWHGGPADARLFGFSDRVFNVSIEDYWMLRLLDVRAALLARGYPPVDAGVALVVQDEVLPENTGRYALVVERGRARVSSGTEPLPSARLSVGSLAALYSGFVVPAELALAGKLEADEGAVAALSLLFAGPAPGLADFF